MDDGGSLLGCGRGCWGRSNSEQTCVRVKRRDFLRLRPMTKLVRLDGCWAEAEAADEAGPELLETTMAAPTALLMKLLKLSLMALMLLNFLLSLDGSLLSLATKVVVVVVVLLLSAVVGGCCGSVEGPTTQIATLLPP